MSKLTNKIEETLNAADAALSEAQHATDAEFAAKCVISSIGFIVEAKFMLQRIKTGLVASGIAAMIREHERKQLEFLKRYFLDDRDIPMKTE